MWGLQTMHEVLAHSIGLSAGSNRLSHAKPSLLYHWRVVLMPDQIDHKINSLIVKEEAGA